MKKIIFIALALMIVLTCLSPAPAASGVAVSPDSIGIGPNFSGAVLTVRGDVPEGADIYIKVSSPPDSVLELNKKGKVGLFWMNVENTVVTKVPKLYQVITSSPVDRLPPKLQEELGMSPGFSFIYSRAEVVRHSEEGPVPLPKNKAGGYISALIDIYKENGLYGIRENAVRVGKGKFESEVKLPPNVPHENCSVTVYAVRDGKVVSTAEASFSIAGVGFVRWLSREAVYDGPGYGFIAVMLALGFGAGIAFIFSFIENIITAAKAPGLTEPGSETGKRTTF